jgi:tRNA A37 N6-isopentenylltransferase MiaA
LSTVAAPQALSALGYSQLQAHLAGQLSEGEMTAAWVQAEVAYAKRQKTWFAKLPGVTWYDAASLDPDQVVQAVKAWYDRR